MRCESRGWNEPWPRGNSPVSPDPELVDSQAYARSSPEEIRLGRVDTNIVLNEYKYDNV